MAERLVPVAITVAMPEGSEIVGLVTFERNGNKLIAVSRPVTGHKRPPRSAPTLLRWLADALDIDALDEVPNG